MFADELDLAQAMRPQPAATPFVFDRYRVQALLAAHDEPAAVGACVAALNLAQTNWRGADFRDDYRLAWVRLALGDATGAQAAALQAAEGAAKSASPYRRRLFTAALRVLGAANLMQQAAATGVFAAKAAYQHAWLARLRQTPVAADYATAAVAAQELAAGSARYALQHALPAWLQQCQAPQSLALFQLGDEAELADWFLAAAAGEHLRLAVTGIGLEYTAQHAVLDTTAGVFWVDWHLGGIHASDPRRDDAVYQMTQAIARKDYNQAARACQLAMNAGYTTHVNATMARLCFMTADYAKSCDYAYLAVVNALQGTDLYGFIDRRMQVSALMLYAAAAVMHTQSVRALLPPNTQLSEPQHQKILALFRRYWRVRLFHATTYPKADDGLLAMFEQPNFQSQLLLAGLKAVESRVSADVGAATRPQSLAIAVHQLRRWYHESAPEEIQGLAQRHLFFAYGPQDGAAMLADVHRSHPELQALQAPVWHQERASFELVTAQGTFWVRGFDGTIIRKTNGQQTMARS